MNFLRCVRCVLLASSLVPVAAGCGDDARPGMPDGGASVRAVFELGPDPIDFGAVPFPDDLYLSDGHVELGAFPREELSDPATVASLRESLREIDGFGVSSPIFVGFDGALDPASLPATPSATLAEDASVFLVDADPASPTAFSRVPVHARWNARDQRLSMQPMDGHPLVPGNRYAAVVTTRVRAADGAPVGPSERFAALRDATSRPDELLAAEAYEQYAPVIASLATHGVSREEIVALAVFRVQTVGRDLADARAIVREAAIPAVTIRRVVGGTDLDALLGVPATSALGTDVPGGVRHESIGWVIDGTFASPELASPAPGVHGRWTREGMALVVKRQEQVWFTLVLPESADLASVPLIVFQHGLGGQRGNVFGVADTLCAAGFAVASIDIPYHGMRTTGGAVDAVHSYGDSEGPDLYGDLGGQVVYADFLGIADESGELVGFHPFYTRDVFRQSVVDLMGLVRTLEEGDFAAVESMGGPAFALAEAPIGFVGISLGGIIGTIFVANEPRVGAALLSVTGGHLARLVEMSPGFAPTFLGILLPRFGWEYGDVDWQAQPATSQPGVAIFQTLLDRGDSMAHAPALARRPVPLLMHMAEHDETVPNVSTESLAAALDVPMAGGTPSFVDLESAILPVSNNVMVDGGDAVTRALVVWSPAQHGMLTVRTEAHRWMHPATPPFESTTPVAVPNPIDAAHQQMRHFFETWRAGAAEIIAP
ncbi:MAG: hypothetical protein M3Y87_22450 [Myxococcota bacterium]|nr:hypothetical protein [Myxococcota bacterium]